MDATEQGQLIDDPMEVTWGDEETAAVLRTVGRVIKKCRERMGLTQAELGLAIGYSEEQVSAVERGRRAPKLQFLKEAERVLDAGGVIIALQQDVEEVRYPKRIRDLRNLEAQAVEICCYADAVIHGLLQTPDYAQALYSSRRPVFSEEEVERLVTARMARHEIFDRQPMPVLSFVLEEVALLRPLGGRMVMRNQLEHLLEVGQRRNVEIQVMPTNCDDHAGLAGSIQLMRLHEGNTVAHTEAQLTSHLMSHPKQVQIVDARYGIIRSRALTPRKSLAFIEKVLGET
ncbi:helix-turn-helix transcriptional regulator [Streptomyces sp. NPDC047017]|uniref:helix-turn-helix domain-containing protein n=1 Tax=Streptomyces sp. NPDC047017 TaxID=3155024 RepID=UPI0033C32737